MLSVKRVVNLSGFKVVWVTNYISFKLWLCKICSQGSLLASAVYFSLFKGFLAMWCFLSLFGIWAVWKTCLRDRGWVGFQLMFDSCSCGEDKSFSCCQVGFACSEEKLNVTVIGACEVPGACEAFVCVLEILKCLCLKLLSCVVLCDLLCIIVYSCALPVRVGSSVKK